MHIKPIANRYLRLLEAALTVSEYTDKIDTLSFGQSKAKRIVAQIKEICSIIAGLTIAADYKAGQDLFQDKDFQANEEFYQTVFELGRRHKVMNPDKMRTTYGKLIYLLQVCSNSLLLLLDANILQDSQTSEIKDLLGFSCVKPVNTVYSILKGTRHLLNREHSELIAMQYQKTTR